jgi:uncharacterized protein YegL
LQCAADAGALAGAAELPRSSTDAETAARDYVRRNAQVQDEDVSVQFGHWNRTARTFAANQTPRDALLVSVQQPDTPLFFGKVAGRSTQSVGGRAVAMFGPRDIALVLDYSGSMNSHNRITELKNAVSLFTSILQQVGAQDRVAFARYSTNGDLIVPLTENLSLVDNQARSYSADGWTNIGEGMERGRLELEQRGRPEATKIMVLMTDGLVNRPLNRDCRAYVLDEAQRAADDDIAAVTVSFGADADRALMQQVADITQGVHFNVPDTVSSQEDDLGDVFRKIALNRPVLLVD